MRPRPAGDRWQGARDILPGRNGFCRYNGRKVDNRQAESVDPELVRREMALMGTCPLPLPPWSHWIAGTPVS